MTLRFLLAAVFTCLAGAALSQQLPRLYDVTGVEAGDTLALRENPRATAGKLGDIPHDATGLEVIELSDSGDWARLSQGEVSGWSALRYLAPQAEVTGGYLAQPLHCFGTEPFWSMQSDGAGAVQYTRMGEAPVAMDMTNRVGELRFGPELADLAGESATATLALTGGLCSDSMSDALYGLNLGVLLRGEDGPEALRGCCSLVVP
ncbi:hypothetical protein [Oceanibium sediminis]|uniref:hypothetical protein n=1 Tax=Oceanibium sediminis TaxID=2026339 RepID=UPI000DD2E932|nr:hypothetical protein [Oceanibium sediminis]